MGARSQRQIYVLCRGSSAQYVHIQIYISIYIFRAGGTLSAFKLVMCQTTGTGSRSQNQSRANDFEAKVFCGAGKATATNLMGACLVLTDSTCSHTGLEGATDWVWQGDRDCDWVINKHTRRAEILTQISGLIHSGGWCSRETNIKWIKRVKNHLSATRSEVTNSAYCADLPASSTEQKKATQQQ